MFYHFDFAIIYCPWGRTRNPFSTDLCLYSDCCQYR